MTYNYYILYDSSGRIVSFAYNRAVLLHLGNQNLISFIIGRYYIS